MIRLNKDTREIIIKDLTIRNDELFNFLEDHDDKEAALEKALSVGAIGLRGMSTGMNIDYIDKRFNQFLTEMERKFTEQHDRVERLFDSSNTDSPMFKLANQLEEYFNDENGVVRNIMNTTFDPNNPSSPVGGMLKNMDSYFSEQGTVRQMMDKHFDLNSKSSSMSQFADKLSENFDVDKGKIKQLLDPARPGSPVNLLREEMSKNIADLSEKIVTTRAEQAVLEKSTQKGGLFEERIMDVLHEITNAHGDTVRDTSKVTGTIGKTGDFVITLRESDEERIVVEAKDAMNYSVNKTIQEIQEAMENRKAECGIFVFKNSEQLPSKLRPCRISRNYIITSMDGNGLYYAYHVARLMMESGRKNHETIPIDKIQAEVVFLLEKSLAIDQAIKKARTINTAVDSIESTLRGLQSEIDQSLKRIQNHLK